MWSKIKNILYEAGGKVALINDNEELFVVMRYDDFLKTVKNKEVGIRRAHDEFLAYQKENPDDEQLSGKDDFMERFNLDIMTAQNDVSSENYGKEKGGFHDKPQLKDLPL